MANPDDHDHRALLSIAHERAASYLDGLTQRRVPATATADDLAASFGGPLPKDHSDPAAVLARPADIAEPGLTAMASPRFFGFVVGGTYPVGIAADWLTSAWDQNAGLRDVTPAHSAAREAVEPGSGNCWACPNGRRSGP